MKWIHDLVSNQAQWARDMRCGVRMSSPECRYGPYRVRTKWLQWAAIRWDPLAIGYCSLDLGRRMRSSSAGWPGLAHWHDRSKGHDIYHVTLACGSQHACSVSDASPVLAQPWLDFFKPSPLYGNAPGSVVSRGSLRCTVSAIKKPRLPTPVKRGPFVRHRCPNVLPRADGRARYPGFV